MQAQTVNIEQAIALVGVCRRTMYAWMESGRVKFIRTAGGQRRIVVSTLYRPGNVDPATLDQS